MLIISNMKHGYSAFSMKLSICNYDNIIISILLDLEGSTYSCHMRIRRDRERLGVE